MARSLASLLLAALMAALVACSSGRRESAPAPAAGIVPDFMPGDLELAIVPTPAEDVPGGLLHPVRGAAAEGAARIHARAVTEALEILGAGSDARLLLGSSDKNGALRAFLQATGTDVDWTWLGREGYQLVVRPHEGRLVIAVAANSREGVLWGVQTLRQITWRQGGTAWVREGVVRDRPALPDRGGKRPLPWEGSFKADFAWQSPPDAETQERGCWRYLPTLAPGERLDASDPAIERALTFFREWSLRGSRAFALRFDDVTFLLDLSGGTDERFGGSYARGLVHFVRAVREGIRTFDRGARLYWLPQTYHESHPQLEVFAREIADAGGLPADVGLVLTGPRVTSEAIPVDSVRRMRRLFGLAETPALVYDNLGREEDFTALGGREPRLVEEVSGVFGERGTMVNRITRLDWNWNPAAYRPDRSLLLAVRELAGPTAFGPTLDLVRALGDGQALPTAERSARLRGLLQKVEAAWDGPGWRPNLDRKSFLAELRAAVEHQGR